ncbi:MAG TPA: hypothetical protein VFR37_20270, partial [Longimicrobium sp.]|nr:hypothetical protein [Longimicrobium sp.]
YAALQAARAGDALVLVPTLFESPAAQGLVHGRPGQRLPLRGLRVVGPPDTPGALTLHGTATQAWAVAGVGDEALAGVTVELAFAASADGPPAVTGTVRGSLRLGDTPLAVSGTLADDGSLELRVDAGTLPARPLAEWTRLVGAPAGRGLLPPTLDDPLQLSPTALTLTLAPTDGAAAVELTTALPGTWDLVPGSLGVRDLSLVARADALASTPARPGSVTLSARVHGTLRLGGGEWQAAVALDGRGGAYAAVFSADGDVLPAFGDLADLAGGTALRDAVQSGFEAMRLTALRLRRASLEVDLDARTLRSVEVEGAVTLDGVELQAGIVLSPPSTPAAGGEDDEGDAADFALTGGLAPGSRIPLRELAAKWLPAAADLPALDVTVLDVFVRPSAGWLRLRAEVASDWTLHAGGLPITLQGVRMALERTPRGADGELAAWCDVAGVRVSVTAVREAGAWTFRGALDNPEETTVASLLSRLTGSPVVLPELVPDVAVRGLQVVLTPSTGALSVDAAAVFAWKSAGGGAVRVDAAVHFARGGDAPWTCTLAIKADGTRRFCDGVEVRGTDLRFALEGSSAWSAAGGMSATVFQRPVELRAAYRATADRRVLSLGSTERVEGTGVALAGLGGFALTRFALEVERTTMEGRPRSRWSVDADALLGGVAVVASARMDGALTVSAKVPEVRVAELIARFLPEGTVLPPELSGLADVALRGLEGSVTPATGVVHLSGTLTGLVIPLPFGAGRLELRTLSFTYDRDDTGSVTLHLGLTGAGALGDGLALDGFAFSLDYDGTRELKLGG